VPGLVVDTSCRVRQEVRELDAIVTMLGGPTMISDNGTELTSPAGYIGRRRSRSNGTAS